MARLLVNGVYLNVDTAGAGPPLVLLHGFTGSAAGWAPHIPAFATRCRVIAIDLLGHGRSDAPVDPHRYGIEHCAQDVLAVLDHLGINQAGVLGYSMGGRLALFLTTAAPDRIHALILVSTSPGLREAAERRARAEQDARLANTIERDGVAAFADRWAQQPIFATQARLPEAARVALRAQRLQHTAHGLANSLRELGLGVQPPLYDHLSRLHIPTLLLAGELDAAYCAVGREMSRLLPDARLAIVSGAGHAVHLEQPEAFRRLVLAFLDESPGGHAAR